MIEFVTIHARVVVQISKDPEIMLRDLARKLDVTERTVQRVVTELHDSGDIVRHRDGRRNHYAIAEHVPLQALEALA